MTDAILPDWRVERWGSGSPLVLFHGLGSSALGWAPMRERLGAAHSCIAVDLPGHGGTGVGPARSFADVVEPVAQWVEREGLGGAVCIGHSLGGQVALELARRGSFARVAALSPAGFWAGWERAFVATSLTLAAAGARATAPLHPVLSATPAGRTALLSQLASAPWQVDPAWALTELTTLIATDSLDDLIAALVAEPQQPGSDRAGVTLLWGTADRLALPTQATRAQAAFPAARLDWIGGAGHYAFWDEPERCADMMLAAVAT